MAKAPGQIKKTGETRNVPKDIDGEIWNVIFGLMKVEKWTSSVPPTPKVVLVLDLRGLI